MEVIVLNSIDSEIALIMSIMTTVTFITFSTINQLSRASYAAELHMGGSLPAHLEAWEMLGQPARRFFRWEVVIPQCHRRQPGVTTAVINWSAWTARLPWGRWRFQALAGSCHSKWSQCWNAAITAGIRSWHSNYRPLLDRSSVGLFRIKWILLISFWNTPAGLKVQECV